MGRDARDVAEEAARAAGAIVRSAEGELRVRRKGSVDLVTQVDLAAEEAIRQLLARRTPDIPVLAEEGGGADDVDTRWIVDPLDGTTNFVHGFPAYCVSVALQEHGELVAGCVYDCVRDEAYVASRGGGAWLGERRLQVSQQEELSAALLLTGFPYDRRERAAYYLRFVQAMIERAQGLRRAGAAALDLCHIAAGRADGFWEFGLQPWDIAAGWLLIEEAGGRVGDMGGGPLDLAHPRLLATNGHVHRQMLAILAPLLSSPDRHPSSPDPG